MNARTKKVLITAAVALAFVTLPTGCTVVASTAGLGGAAGAGVTGTGAGAGAAGGGAVGGVIPPATLP
ncbi:prenyltransferase [Mycobacterium numidiamassiliense]|jgi:hypothetical protein|uniref:prenyltransferase n=1 Tax=Mycobacterium numidiamassiliense TaxID=1841861 RepID=UPI001055E098|nr:prenyltransferase [Mycobacterium numidiamassiliense]